MTDIMPTIVREYLETGRETERKGAVPVAYRVEGGGMQERIRKLIAETEQWREFHKANRHSVDAAACEIRIQALYDALGEKRPKPKGA